MSPTCVPEAVMVADMEKVGSVLEMVTESLSEALPPSASVTVTAHCTESFGDVSEGVSWRVLVVDA